jgi:hypothetical protein
MRVGAISLFFAIALAAAPASAQPLVYRVDQVTATSEGGTLTVKAMGAVRSGGWKHARLVLRNAAAADGGDIEIDFVATPPSNKKAVIQSIVPKSVRLKLRLPRSTAPSVRVNGETNSVTVPVSVKPALQRTARS